MSRMPAIPRQFTDSKRRLARERSIFPDQLDFRSDVPCVPQRPLLGRWGTLDHFGASYSSTSIGVVISVAGAEASVAAGSSASIVLRVNTISTRRF